MEKLPNCLRSFGGAPGGTRTPNLLIRSQTLYPLSYGCVVERLYLFRGEKSRNRSGGGVFWDVSIVSGAILVQ